MGTYSNGSPPERNHTHVLLTLEGIKRQKMPVRYVGRVTYERGKPLYEILARLKNFGVGRLVYRNREITNYEEPSFCMITKVHPEMTEPLDSITHRVTAHKYFRGEYVGELKMRSCYKPDWRLVPRDMEQQLLNYSPAQERPRPIIPDTMGLPPLLEKMAKEEKKKAGEDVSEPIRIPLSIKVSPLNRAVLESEARTLGLIS